MFLNQNKGKILVMMQVECDDINANFTQEYSDWAVIAFSIIYWIAITLSINKV